MGQQQFLLLIIAACIVGIAFSIGLIELQSAGDEFNRELIFAELLQIARKAQEYRNIPYEKEGGDGTFYGLTPTQEGIRKLIDPPTMRYGSFSIARAGNEHTVQVVAVGISPGRDPLKPIKMYLNVNARSFSIIEVN